MASTIVFTETPHSSMSDWATQANCLGSDPEALFVQGAAQHQAKKICVGCPVRLECLSDALDNKTEFGVWGGATERERRAMLRRNPQIRSWRERLLSGKAQSA